MQQITIPVPIPDMTNWRTTLFGLATSALYAGATYYMHGGVSWQEAAACAVWAVKCYLSADASTTAKRGLEGAE